MYRTKFTEQNIPDKIYLTKYTWTKYTRTIPDKISMTKNQTHIIDSRIFQFLKETIITGSKGLSKR